MSKLITVGRIMDQVVEAAALSMAGAVAALPTNWLGRLKRTEIPWLACEPEIVTIDCLNVTSVAAFLRHAAELEGIRVEDRIGSTEWPHLPDYEETYWLPIEAAAPQVFTKDDGWPFAIGSSPALLRELATIKVRSPYALGTKPAGFNVSDAVPLSPEATLQWVWLALHESASRAVAVNAPLAI